ncbi:MAG: hypothetical protein ACYCY6_01335 [Minisyncoccota bacterium]
MSKKFATASGWVLVLLGIMGLFGTSIIGGGPRAYFMVDTAMSVVHLFLGSLLMYVAYMISEKSSKMLKIVGVILLVLSVGGFFSEGAVLDLVLTNSATDYMHIVLALLFLWGSMSKNSEPHGPLPMGTM